jgi:uncharacterized protein YggT (Ycf19 family)
MYILWYIFGVLEALLAFRFVFKLLAANPGAGFTNFIYKTSQPLVNPFLSVFHINRVDTGVVEWTTLLAMFVYWLVALAIVKLLFMSKEMTT